MHDSLVDSSSATSLRNQADLVPSRPKARGHVAHADNSALLEETYEQWKVDPDSVDATWRSFFEGFELGCQLSTSEVSRLSGSLPKAPAGPLNPSAAGDATYRLKQARVYNLLLAYRILGHHEANLDPLGFNKTTVPELDLSHFKFTEQDLDTLFDSGSLAGGGERPLREIIQTLRETYCGNIGAEYMHIQNFTMRRWLRDRMEKVRNKPSYAPEKKKRILTRLLAAEQFERFLHTRYVGQKRFSIEGGETLISMLDAAIESCPQLGIQQLVMGMAHRGRLNVLVNIMGKSYQDLFSEFSENYAPKTVQGDGDVKYHMGFDSKRTTSSGHEVGLSLAPNPSHLEAVDPVVEGKARAWQRLLNDTAERRKVLPVLIHGDAAFIGQGIVAETFNLSQLEGYKTGGTLHLVINNQIGFTTLPQDARSSTYCTALAKAIGAPIFHVNGDDPLSAVYLIDLALEFRQRFQRDVIIDVVCYRRQGHNEGDEPNFTQPTLYTKIEQHPLISETYMKALMAAGDIAPQEADGYKAQFEEELNRALIGAKATAQNFKPAIRKPLSCPEMLNTVETAVTMEELLFVGRQLTRDPENFNLHPKLKKWLQNRRTMIEGEKPVDWGFAEALAFGTLVNEKHPVRLSGQDSRRGTFSHRHSVFYDTKTRERHVPIKKISADQASFCVYNSPLSEAAVLGFDFGYSLDFRDILILWEAQFGDFANGAQTIIDQYIVSSESKWGVTSNIVLLLPHGYEGQGPEHSSGRMERFLQMCAEDNIQVCNCTTGANYFHLLRRQGIRQIHKPLVVFTPKSLLRSDNACSPLADFTTGSFLEVIPDITIPPGARRVILCQGKVYYDLDAHRKEQNITDVAIIRLEQIYPLHEAKLRAALEFHPDAEKIVWCQEESQNQGAWTHLEPRLRALFGRDIAYAGRDASASPAVGALSLHKLEQKDVVQQAFTV
jgi:2-oxoglutarate dehydrogenase E1 component